MRSIACFSRAFENVVISRATSKFCVFIFPFSSSPVPPAKVLFFSLPKPLKVDLGLAPVLPSCFPPPAPPDQWCEKPLGAQKCTFHIFGWGARGEDVEKKTKPQNMRVARGILTFSKGEKMLATIFSCLSNFICRAVLTVFAILTSFYIGFLSV